MRHQNPFFGPKSKPLVLGHRGVPLRFQENTVAGLRCALELGIDGVEFDVMTTRDGKVVLFHDDDLERLTGEKGPLAEKTWDELSRLRIKRTLYMGKDAAGQDVWVTYPNPEPIPLLEEVLAEFKGKLLMNVEMKPPAPSWLNREAGGRVAQVIRDSGAQDSLVVTSFDFFKLMALEKEHPGLHSGFAYDDNFLDFIPAWFQWVPELPAELAAREGNQNREVLLNRLLEANRIGKWIDSTVIDLEHTLIDSDTVPKLKAQGLSVGTYTVFPLDTVGVKQPLPEEAELRLAHFLIGQNVDWIETDDPERLVAIRG